MEPQPSHISSHLVEQCKAGNRKAQAQLYQTYSKAMYNICTRMLVRKEDAEDALQEAFIDAFRNIHQYRGDATIGSWIKRITINKCINIAKRRQFNYDEIPEIASHQNLEINAMEREITPGMIHSAVKKLPDGCRVIFTLNILEGYDHGEIAEILKVSESTSKSQLHRAKNLLRNILTESNHVG